jgi:hypothetical protein
MKKLASTIFLVVALVGSSFAQTQTPPKPGRMISVQAKSKPSTGCKLIGTVKGTKLWAGDCVTAEAAAPSPGEPQSEPDKQ